MKRPRDHARGSNVGPLRHDALASAKGAGIGIAPKEEPPPNEGSFQAQAGPT